MRGCTVIFIQHRAHMFVQKHVHLRRIVDCLGWFAIYVACRIFCHISSLQWHVPVVLLHEFQELVAVVVGVEMAF